MATVEKPVLARYGDRMDKAVPVLKEELASLRSGRPPSSLLDQIKRQAYGSTLPIQPTGACPGPGTGKKCAGSFWFCRRPLSRLIWRSRCRDT